MRRVHHHLATCVAAMLCAVPALAGQPQAPAKAPPRQNPLLNPSTLPFHAPPFDKIRDADFQPAIDRGIRENLAEIEKALKSGGNEHVVIKELPRLNHLFQTSETGLPAEYARIEETIAPSVLTLIGDWITDQITKRR